MKIKVLATAQSPDYYTFNGEVITAHLGGQSKSYDLSAVSEGDQVTVEDIGGVRAIREVKRTASGELEVKLTQAVGPGHWKEGDWISPAEYDPNGINVVFTGPAAGTPSVKTGNGVVTMGASLEA